MTELQQTDSISQATGARAAGAVVDFQPATSGPVTATRLAAVVAARMCHDLINPIGAIGNGIELMGLTGTADGPEAELISDSVRHAQARIRFFRIAYGDFTPAQRISSREVRSVLDGIVNKRTLIIDWGIDSDLPRRDVKLAFLLIQCLETALPRGGRIDITADSRGWRIIGRGPRIQYDAALWEQLGDPAVHLPQQPAQVQFALVALHAAETGCRLTLDADQDMVGIFYNTSRISMP